MKKSLSLTICLSLMLLCFGFMEASAQAPSTISYQGRLTQLDGTAITGANSVIFSIYDVSSGGVAVWVDTLTVDPDDNGIFTVELGPIGISVFNGDKLYLGVTVGNDSEMTPRQLLTSAPYSMATEQVDDASITTAKLANDAVTSLKIATGEVGTVDLADNAVTAAKIAPGVVGTTDMADNAITTGKIAGGAVGTSDIAGNAITTALIAAGAVGTTDIADNAVTTAKIAAGAVTNSDLGNNAVTAAKISNGTITMADIGQNSATTGQVIKWSGSAWAPSSDNNSGDITGVTAGTGLNGGGISGTVTLNIATSGVTTSHILNSTITGTDIADGTIMNADINNSAAITTNKIYGTAMNLSSNQWITGVKTFEGTCYFGDSTLRVSNTGISIGDNYSPSSSYLVRAERNFNTSSTRTGYYANIDNSGTGTIYGIRSYADATTAITGGSVYGVRGSGISDGTRYGVYGYTAATTGTWYTNNSYGVRGAAYDGLNCYGVYGYASSGLYNYGGYFTQAKEPNSYAGYFEGDVEATGFSSTGSGGIKIDHPLDPTGKYLLHSHIESPDMLNVYSGNVTTDADGGADVQLPDYFESLNKDFRYQLTVIGTFAQAIIGEEIRNNSFSIKTDLPYIKVSWQVTGIRKDAFAEAYRVSPEVDKPAHEVGLYLHPEARGISGEQSIHYEARRQVELDDEQAEADRIASENQP